MSPVGICSGNPLVTRTQCDVDHLGRTLAARYKLGFDYIADVKDRVRGKAALDALNAGGRV